ncbi:Arm DNA-binding domain-containing protein [Paracoccus homiensis]|uniref:Arm DNA-binding domain-containing protein n=1 Tax=Paracoccus homiensis TaxID=364199 RepID=UPI00398CD4E4
MALTLTRIKNLAPENGKPRRESDGGGLYIEATAKGFKLWKMAYRIGPKQKTLSFGSWPAVSIVEARAMREQAKKALAAGEDPGAIKKALKAGAWVRLSTSGRVSSSSSAALRNTNQPHSLRLISSNGAAKQFGGLPITDISVPQIIDALRAIVRTGKLHKSAKAKTFIS